MLLAATNQLCQDLAVMPFLWVLPLAAYLLSFIIAFDRPGWYRPTLFGLLAAALVPVTVYLVEADFTLTMAVGVPLILAVLFCVCMLGHGDLARLKPAPRHLTGYYLAVSGGGALGGLLVSVVAPIAFSTFFEWTLGMAAAYAAACGRVAWAHRDRIRAHRYVGAVFLAIGAAGLVLVGAFSKRWRPPLEAARNYYGVATVTEHPGWPPHMRPSH
jgi:hypothetical protein